MPTYEYSCRACDSRHEIQQKMADPTLTDCPDCGASGLRKLFTNVGVVFKGSGFYRTDSRDAKSARTAASDAKDSSGKDSGSKDSLSSSSSSSSSSSDSGSSAGPASSSSGSSKTPATSTPAAAPA